MAVLHFKLQKDASPEEKEDLLNHQLLGSDVKAVKALFPGHKNASLARLYSVETPDDSGATRILDVLRKSRSVEYAEEAVERTPI
jgi:hypothetical protein